MFLIQTQNIAELVRFSLFPAINVLFYNSKHKSKDIIYTKMTTTVQFILFCVWWKTWSKL